MTARDGGEAISQKPAPFAVATALRSSAGSSSLPSVEEFVELLERSQLVPPRQLEAMRTRVLADGALNAREFAQSLVEAGHLTRWQAERLLARKAGFVVGKYRLIDRIGAGGMAVVLKGQQIGMSRTVAIKVLARTLLKRPEAVKRFFREIEAASSLDHPNIVRALDSDCIDGVPFLVMEYVEGRDLHSLVTQRGPLPVTWACELIRQAAIGLQHAFEHDVVHRDIKPANLLVMQRPMQDAMTVKILDFGLARFASDTPDTGALTNANQIFGTVDYIAPEQARSARTADTRADIFSLGCTLYFLLTSRTPFKGETAMEKLTSRLTEPPIPIDTLRPDIPDALAEVIARMLALDPKDRYQTPADVAHALAPFCSSTNGEAAESTVLARRGDDGRPDSSASEMALENFLGHLQQGDVDAPSPSTLSGRRRKIAASIVTAIVLVLILTVAIFLMTAPPRTSSRPAPEKPPDGAVEPLVPDDKVTSPADAMAAWPGDHQGLIAAWHKSDSDHLRGHLFASDWGLEFRGSARAEADGTLTLGDDSTVAINGPEGFLRKSCAETGEFTVELVCTPATLRTGSPVRIFSFANNRSRWNFAIAQFRENLVARLNTSLTASGKSAPDAELCKLTADRARHILVSYQDGQLVCYLDGEKVSERDDVRGDLSTWTTQELLLGEDMRSGRGWSGQIERFALFSRFFTADEARKQFELSQQPVAENSPESP